MCWLVRLVFSRGSMRLTMWIWLGGVGHNRLILEYSLHASTSRGLVAVADYMGWSVNMNLSRSCFRRDNGSSIRKCAIKRLMTQNVGTANYNATLIMITVMIVTSYNKCVCNIGKKLIEVTGDPMETSYFSSKALCYYSQRQGYFFRWNFVGLRYRANAFVLVVEYFNICQQ